MKFFIVMIMHIRNFRINSFRNEAKNVILYKLESSTGEKVNFKPGQFVNLYLLEDGKPGIFRQFSIASAPSETQLEFCIKILPDGKFTSVLEKLQVGTELGVAGPFGHFTYNEQTDCVFLGAGTGIAPIISMLRHIKKNDVRGNFTLFYSNKTEDSIIYYDELKKLSNEGINVVFTLTQETSENWKGENGRINPYMISKYVVNPGKMSWYSCGPLEFVKMIKEHAMTNGVPPDRIKVEGWG